MAKPQNRMTEPQTGTASVESAPEGSTLRCETGLTRIFGLADIGPAGLRSGWAESENGHIWNDGFDATLLLEAKDDPVPTVLVLEGEPYVTPAQPTQDLTIYFNGARVGFWRMNERKDQMLRAEIDPEWWHRHGSRLLAHVVFHLPQSVRPADIGDGKDVRSLGFCFRTLLLEAS